MAWEPEKSAADVRPIVGNLIAFFTANIAAALTWASPSRPLTALTFYDSAEVRILNDFPHFGIVKRRTTQQQADDGLRITYTLTFEMEIAATHTEATRTATLTQLRKDADNYAYAVESMFNNIPPATLLANVNGVTGEFGRELTSTDPLEVAISNTKSLYNIQQEVTVAIIANPYED